MWIESINNERVVSTEPVECVTAKGRPLAPGYECVCLCVCVSALNIIGKKRREKNKEKEYIYMYKKETELPTTKENRKWSGCGKWKGQTGKGAFSDSVVLDRDSLRWIKSQHLSPSLSIKAKSWSSRSPFPTPSLYDCWKPDAGLDFAVTRAH